MPVGIADLVIGEVLEISAEGGARKGKGELHPNFDCGSSLRCSSGFWFCATTCSLP